MAIYHEVFVTTKATKKTKENVGIDAFASICQYQKKYMDIPRMAGKVKEFVKQNVLSEHSFGSNYNGYGYEDKTHQYLLTPANAKKLQAIIESKKVERKQKTEDEKMEAWCKRLVKLAGISIEEARQIAEEKLMYKQQQIDMMNERQQWRHSVKREKLINKMWRENPLRRIEDEDHARAIIAASHRHNDSNYEALLEKYGTYAQCGMMGFEDVRELARQNATYYNQTN